MSANLGFEKRACMDFGGAMYVVRGVEISYPVSCAITHSSFTIVLCQASSQSVKCQHVHLTNNIFLPPRTFFQFLCIFCPPSLPPPLQRIRSGSISGRLRSASELEDKGIIDRMQKGALKNLIMSGDEHLLSALDKFSVEGDSTELHALLKSGALEGQPGLDLDLLMDDLDMNFLHLTSGLGGGGGGGAGGAAGTGGVGAAGGGGREGGQGGVEVENYQFDMDDMASFIAGDHGVGQGVGAGSFVDDLNLLVGGGVGGGMGGRSMSPGQGGSLSGLGFSPFGLEGGGGGGGAGTYFVAVKEEFPLQQGGRRGLGGGMGGKGKVVKGTGPALSIKNKPPSGSPSSSSSPSSIPPSSSASGPAGTRGHAIPRPSPLPQTKGQKKTTAAAAAAAAASVVNGAATVGAALANKPHSVGAAKGNNSNNSSTSGKASPTPPNAAGISSSSHAPSSSSTTTTSSGCGNGAASLLMPVPRASPPPSLPHSSERDVNKHYIGAYSPESRRMRLEKFWDKKKNRIWDRKVKYDVRKNFADSRVRVKGRFVKKEDEAILIEVNTLTSREGAMDAVPASAGGGGEGGGMSASSLMPGVEGGREEAIFQHLMMPSSNSGGGGGGEMVMLKEEVDLEEVEDGNEIAAGVEDLEDLLAPLEGL